MLCWETSRIEVSTTSISERPCLAVWGASGHAMVVVDIVRLQGVYQIVGFLDDVNPDRYGLNSVVLRSLGGNEQFADPARSGHKTYTAGFWGSQNAIKANQRSPITGLYFSSRNPSPHNRGGASCVRTQVR